MDADEKDGQTVQEELVALNEIILILGRFDIEAERRILGFLNDRNKLPQE